MHGLRFEYEHEGPDVIVVARCEDDHGLTHVVRTRAVDAGRTSGAQSDPMLIAARLQLGRETAAAVLSEVLGA